MKKCSKCGKSYPATEEFFRKRTSRTGKVTLWSPCRDCERKYTRDYCRKYETWKIPRVREYRKTYGVVHKDRIRKWWLNKKYNITVEQFDQMVEMQNNKCAICGSSLEGIKQNRHVDHDHKTGKVRGILCHKCNRGLGYFNDDPVLLKSAAEYVTI